MDKVLICCDIKCSERFGCAKFGRALDVVAGKITSNYSIVQKCEYEK